MQSGRDPAAFWPLSLCQVMHVFQTISGGTRRTASGHSYRKARPGDLANLYARMSGYTNVGKYRVGPEGEEAPPVP